MECLRDEARLGDLPKRVDEKACVEIEPFGEIVSVGVGFAAGNASAVDERLHSADGSLQRLERVNLLVRGIVAVRRLPVVDGVHKVDDVLERNGRSCSTVDNDRSVGVDELKVRAECECRCAEDYAGWNIV